MVTGTNPRVKGSYSSRRTIFLWGRGGIAVRVCASVPSCAGFDSWHSQNYIRGKLVNIAEVYQWRCCLKQWTADA